ncbi:MAG: peptide chain release factor 2 [Clostridium sp.]|nr:MAG: peptide chain release factor 2 [Clostridium sp.]
MIDLDENTKKLESLKNRLKEVGDSLDIASLEEELHALEKKTEEPSFWEDSQNSSRILKRINELKNKTENYKKISSTFEYIEELNELVKSEIQEGTKQEELDSEAKEILDTTENLEKDIEKLEITTLLSGKYDNNNAILTLHPGAGGTEAQDWVEMLYRMYCRWANSNGYGVKELDYLAGDEAGIKSVTFLVSGPYAYGYLKGEMGVHRLVRISPFDAGGRRHTSFASLEVLPEITEDVEININPDDLRVDTYRASGAGGQHINKTSSAIRITHIPTNIVVTCQSERSQIQNRETAMKMLKSKLLDLKEKENKDTIDDLKGVQMDIAWGSQIRSYVFCPYTLVKDHRTNYEVGNVQAVMDGDLNGFIDSYLKYNASSNS